MVDHAPVALDGFGKLVDASAGMVHFSGRVRRRIQSGRILLLRRGERRQSGVETSSRAPSRAAATGRLGWAGLPGLCNCRSRNFWLVHQASIWG
jgi:hypothetical protein